MGYFSVDATSILIQKTGTSIAEKSTLIKIVTSKHIMVFVLYIQLLCLKLSHFDSKHLLETFIFTSPRMHVGMIAHALTQTAGMHEITGPTKTPDSTIYQNTIAYLFLQAHIWVSDAVYKHRIANTIPMRSNNCVERIRGVKLLTELLCKLTAAFDDFE